MRNVTIITAVVLLAAGASQVATADDRLVVAASTAEIDIAPLPPGPRIIHLPDTTFTLSITAYCGDNMHAESASISIADTTQTVGPELLADTATTEQSINIPHNQLAPLSIENFCFNDGSQNEDPHLYIADALTAQLSLLCVDATRRSISYQAAPLGMDLRCASVADD
jgi:hypothetical protein